ncbi:MAG TPA: branched-chain amino acid ABC transporter permease [Xanthobacteraceae bacterium]|nr:branched-chain amino acid ABC transporter permease [Xanthobacteraceae bacterium]
MERVVDPAAPVVHVAHDRGQLVAFALIVLVLVVAPAFVYPVFLMKALCFALFACAFNLLVGYGGLLSFGHALFFGWAGYIAAHMAKVGTIKLPYPVGWRIWEWLDVPLPPLTPELAILVGTAAAAVLGLVAGWLAIRRQGIYFAMITLALAQMMYFFALQASFTGGEDGIQGVPRGYLFGVVDLRNEAAMYITVVVVFLFGFLLIYRIIHSPFGEVLKAIRENEPRAISLGYKTERYKLLAFVLSATIAGLAGATKAIVFQLASLTDVHWSMSGEVVLMTLVGGLGTIFGPVVGAVIIVGMENYLAGFGEWVTVLQGVIFVACVLLFRRGIVGEVAHLLRIRL